MIKLHTERKEAYPEVLAPGQIRMVKILPPSERSDRLYGAYKDTLNLGLETVPFPPPADKPYSYVAFSRDLRFAGTENSECFVNGVECVYSLGAERMMQNLKNDCLGGSSAVLEAAIAGRQIAPDDAYEQIPLVWVDELCIDDQQASEVASHATLTKNIYKHATQTHIWIGPRKEFGFYLGVNPLTGGIRAKNRHGIIEDLYPHDADLLEAFGKRVIDAGIWHVEPNDAARWNDIHPDRAHVKEALQSLMTGDGITKFPLDEGISKLPLDALIAVSQNDLLKNPWIPAALLQSPTPAKLVRDQCVVGAEEFFACVMFCKYYMANQVGLIKTGTLFDRIKSVLRGAKKNSVIIMRVRKLERYGMSTSPGPAVEHLSILHQLRGDKTGRGLAWWMQHITNTTYDVDDFSQGWDHVRARSHILMSLAADAQQLDWKPDGNFVTQKHVLLGLVKPLLESGQLHILSGCRGPSTFKEPFTALQKYRGGFYDFKMPSWLPDFSKPIYPSWHPSPEHGVFNASANLPKAVKGPSVTGIDDQDDTPQLHLQAIHLGKIAKLGTPFRPGAPTSPMPGETLFTELQTFLNDAESRYTAPQRAEGIWRIPARDIEPVSTHPLRLKWRRATFENAGVQCARIRELEPRVTGTDDPEAKRESRKLWYLDAMQTLWDARPAILTSGYVGLVPITSTVGDGVYVPLTSHVPYVFGTRGEGRAGAVELIGESFMFGAMDGEVQGKDEDIVDLIVV